MEQQQEYHSLTPVELVNKYEENKKQQESGLP